MGETTGAGLPEENLETAIDPVDQAELEQHMFDLIVKDRAIAKAQMIRGADTRDGTYTAWAYNSFANAGIILTLLKMQDTDNARRLLGLLEEADATKEHRAGAKQLL